MHVRGKRMDVWYSLPGLRLIAIANHQLPEKFYDLCVCSSQVSRLHFGSYPNRRLRILIKILTLRLCSYINLFSCQISSLHSPPERLWADLGLPVLPLRAFTLRPFTLH